MAVLAWIFTMSAGFLDALQEHWSATQIAASNVWTWLVSDMKNGRRIILIYLLATDYHRMDHSRDTAQSYNNRCCAASR